MSEGSAILDPVSEDQENQKKFEQFLPENFSGPDALETIENYAQRMRDLAEDENRQNDSLRLNFHDLEVLINNHCYDKLSAAIHLGQLKRRLKRTQRQMRERSSLLYKRVTERFLGINQPPAPPSAAGTKTVAKSTGIQKIDAEYRQSEYLQDQVYQDLATREEELVELVTVVEAIYECYQDKARFILGMQKALNQDR